MATAKSLKRLRSASSAFLEDGGSLLHGVDGLLRDVQQTLIDLQRREELLVEREIAFEAREVCLNALLQKLADNVSSIRPLAPAIVAASSPALATNQSPLSQPLEVAIPAAESKLVNELTELQSTVTEIVSPTQTSETSIQALTPNSSQRFSHQRKKRRR